MKALINGKLIIGHNIIEGKTIFFDRKILSIETGILPDRYVEVIDARGAYVSPGFIDIHIHGSGGADVMDATSEALQTISKTILQTGTTSFLATTMTMPQEKIVQALENVRSSKELLSGAEVIGIHLEGPFINPSKHGAQDQQYVQSPTLEWIDRYTDVIRMITLAPEVAGGENFVQECKRRYDKIILSIGHSDANYDQSLVGFDAGISHVTHLFNAMPAYHHREPGIVGACFDRVDVTCDVIADLVHTHPHHLRLAQKMKQDNLILITDAMRAGCMKNGTYDLGGQTVFVDNVKAYLHDGTLAGSVLRMDRALQTMVKHTEMDMTDAVYSVTEAPARKLGVKKGVLCIGYDADMVLFDEDFSIISTIVAGEVKYQGANRCLDF